MLRNQFWEGKKVIVTGHTGFKGSWLWLWLHKLGAETWGLSLEANTSPSLFNELRKSLPSNSLTHKIADIRDLNAVKELVESSQPDVVFHLAAQPIVKLSYADPMETWTTNVIGSLNILESLKKLEKPCSVVMITTDKVYENKEWIHGYRESDRLGGRDPYSASKAAAEIAIASWRSSFCGEKDHQTPYINIATARSGNVIGGGDWASDRIIPDAIRSLIKNEPIKIRNPKATRPWQHVIEPLSGYLKLAEMLVIEKEAPCEAFNFGPTIESNQTVETLVETITGHWPGEWVHEDLPMAVHEANLLHLEIDKAFHRIRWKPQWNYAQSIAKTVEWYESYYNGKSALQCCIDDLEAYTKIQLISS